MSYKVTVRRGSKVEHAQHATLDEALAAMQAAAHGRTGAVEALGRRYEAKDLVAARIELKGPKTKAGVDVRGDGTVVAWSGRVFRKELPGRDPFEALRQSVSVAPYRFSQAE